jgi:broad specificity phosphatase PhoE
MQLLLIRHALPMRSAAGEGSDPQLSETGFEQARRLPDAPQRYPIARVVSSPQRRACQTADPLAGALGLPVDVDDRLAEYDRDHPEYVPVEHIRARIRRSWRG